MLGLLVIKPLIRFTRLHLLLIGKKPDGRQRSLSPDFFFCIFLLCSSPGATSPLFFGPAALRFPHGVAALSPLRFRQDRPHQDIRRPIRHGEPLLISNPSPPLTRHRFLLCLSLLPGKRCAISTAAEARTRTSGTRPKSATMSASVRTFESVAFLFRRRCRRLIIAMYSQMHRRPASPMLERRGRARENRTRPSSLTSTPLS